MASVASAAVVPGVTAAIPTTADVVVVGAGAAGIGAARALMKAGKSVVVLEAAERLGGRAFTETDTFGFPYDRGCAWLQGPADLPHLALAREHEFNLVDFENSKEMVFGDGRRAKKKARRAYWRSWEMIERALAAAEGQDVAAADVIPTDAPYSATVQSWIGPLDHGVDFQDLSTADYNAYADLEIDYLVREGMGTLVRMIGEKVPVQLGTPVTRIDWSGSGVKVETSAGTVQARTCIVTVSSGVLAGGAIRFTPALPERKQQAIDDVPMGLLERVGLQFGNERFGLSESAILTRLHEGPVPASTCQFLTFPAGSDVVVGFVGGTFGWELAAEGEDAAIDFALEAFVGAVGSDARQHFVKGHFSNWANNSLTRGAYAAARPGRHTSRAVLGEPVAERVFFAGEALAGDHNALMSGAHMSGEAVAATVVAALDGTSGCSSCDARHQQRQRVGEGSNG